LVANNCVALLRDFVQVVRGSAVAGADFMHEAEHDYACAYVSDRVRVFGARRLTTVLASEKRSLIEADENLALAASVTQRLATTNREATYFIMDGNRAIGPS